MWRRHQSWMLQPRTWPGMSPKLIIHGFSLLIDCTQVCCAVDAGHCPHGFYCASVPGKCCRKVRPQRAIHRRRLSADLKKHQTAEECNLGVNAEVFGLPGLVGHELSGVKTMTTTKIISITITTSVMDPINMMTESQPSFVTADTDKAMLSTSECSEENLIVTTTSTSAIASDGPIRDAVTEVPGLISEIGAGPVTEILSSPAPKRPSEQTTTTTDAPDKAISIDGFWSTIPCPPPHLMSSNKTNSTASPIISSQTAGRNAGSSLALAVIMAIMASW